MNKLVTLMLLPAPERTCDFGEVRKTKAWNYNPLVSSVLYFASSQGDMHSMKVDIILGVKFPHPMWRDFSWLIEPQSA
jgi:hypothetical protein